jgi:hypothetical protein
VPRYAAILDTSVLVDPTLWRVLVGVGVNTDLYRVMAAERSIRSAVDVGCRAKARAGDVAADIEAYRTREVAARIGALGHGVLVGSEFAAVEQAFRETLRDADDAYVAAAAIVGRADVIVTHNVGDFTPLPGNLSVQDPDTFLTEQLAHAPMAVVRTLEELAQAMRVGIDPPPNDLPRLLAQLDHPVRAPTFAAEVTALLA